LASKKELKINYARQSISDVDIQAVVSVLKSDLLTQGPIVPKFEQAICEYTGSKYAVAVNSGTSALHIACLALGLGEKDVLWSSPNTFVASTNCALHCGADVDFVDIDPLTCCMSVEKLEAKLINAKTNKCLPKIVVPVHFGGLSCNMKRIRELSKEYGFFVIEDAAHAIGGRYLNSAVGSCEYSDIAIFSFHPVKTITSGEGGMVVTNSKTIARKISLLRSHGITRDNDLMTKEPEGPWYYEQVDLGYNYRMTDIHAALGLSQFLRLDEFVKKRHTIFEKYKLLLSDIPVEFQFQSQECYSGMHLCIIRLKLDELVKSHREIFEELCRKKIIVNLHYIPVHLQPWYRRMGFSEGDFPMSEQYYREVISIPCYPDLTDREIHWVSEILHQVIR